MSLYCVPEDANCPTPVTFERIKRVIEYLGTSMEQLDANSAIAHFDAIPFLLSFTSEGRFLSIRSEWNSQTTPTENTLSVLFSSADTWNRERYFPTIYTVVEDEQVIVVVDYITDVSNYLNDEQLLDNVSAAIATGAEALGYMQRVVKVTTKA